MYEYSKIISETLTLFRSI